MVGTPLRTMGLMWTIRHVAAVAVVDERENGRIAHVAAIPEMLAVDFHSLEQEGQAGRGQNRIGGNFRFSKMRTLPVSTLVAQGRA